MNWINLFDGTFIDPAPMATGMNHSDPFSELQLYRANAWQYNFAPHDLGLLLPKMISKPGCITQASG